MALLAVLGGGWLALAPFTTHVEATVVKHLQENGVYPRYVKRSWLPWRGLHLEGVTLYKNASGNEPVIEISALDVTFPWRNIWRTRRLSSIWRTNGANLTFHDSAGAVALQNVTTKVVVQPGIVDVPRLQVGAGAVVWDIAGKILFKGDAETSPPAGDFAVDLSVIRAVEETLDIKPGTGPLHVAGTFSVDLRPATTVWDAKLRGTGKTLEWHDVPLRDVAIDAQLSSLDLKLSANLQLTKGSAALTASRQDWDKAPLVFAGRLADSAGRRDSISGKYEGASAALTLTNIRGNGDLLEFAHNFPALVPYLPTGLRPRTFPDLELTNLSYRESKSGTTWSLGSLDLRSPADLVITVSGKPLAIDHLTGRAAFHDQSWQLTNMAGETLGGRFAFGGAYARGALRQANLELTEMRMKEVGLWIGEHDAALDAALLSLNYRGEVGASVAQLTGAGSVHLENAPVVKVPLLDETYGLFSTLFPGVRRHGTGNLKSTFTVSSGVFHVSSFIAHSEALNVTGNGTVDLVRRRVDGEAQANLRGVAGVATAPLSKALEMKVSGPLNNIQVEPIGPVGIVGGSISGTAQLPGKILKEGVRLPGKLLELFTGGSKPPDPPVPAGH